MSKTSFIVGHGKYGQAKPIHLGLVYPGSHGIYCELVNIQVQVCQPKAS